MSVQGLIGKKIGTTQVFRDDNSADCVTVIRVESCVITQVKTIEKDGYSSVQVGSIKSKNPNMPLKGHLGVDNTAYKVLREFKVFDSSQINTGDVLDVGMFEVGEKVNVSALSKGRGFAGTIKRHGFHGGPKTHGQSDRHRAVGSIGAGSSPGRVWPGTRMPGHYGNEKATIKGLSIAKIDTKNNILVIKGSIPGHNGSNVRIEIQK